MPQFYFTIADKRVGLRESMAPVDVMAFRIFFLCFWLARIWRLLKIVSKMVRLPSKILQNLFDLLEERGHVIIFHINLKKVEDNLCHQPCPFKDQYLSLPRLEWGTCRMPWVVERIFSPESLSCKWSAISDVQFEKTGVSIPSKISPDVTNFVTSLQKIVWPAAKSLNRFLMKGTLLERKESPLRKKSPPTMNVPPQDPMHKACLEQSVELFLDVYQIIHLLRIMAWNVVWMHGLEQSRLQEVMILMAMKNFKL